MDSKITGVIRRLFDVDMAVTLSRPDSQFGDYATNVALQLAKSLERNPRDIAEEIAVQLRVEGDYSEITVAGPGFINLRLHDETLTNELRNIIERPDAYGRPHFYKDKIVVIEYSDPNPFKILHIGHFYTSVVGAAISNLIEYAGGEVHRVNFGGDVGLHVAKAMQAIVGKLGGEYPEKLADIPIEHRSKWLARCYVEGTHLYETDDAAKKEIIALNKKIYQLHTDNDHESSLAQVYWTCRKWSYDDFNEFYRRIETPFEKYYPESEVAPIGLKIVLEQKEEGVYKDSNGAVVFEGEPHSLHTRVFINSEGLPTYEAKDVGLSIQKWNDYQFDESIIITGNDIIEYMKVVLKSIEQFEPNLARRTKHLTHGNVKLAGSVKMSSRKGNVLFAVDVIEMIAAANEEAQGNRSDEPVLGAIKYAFLKNRIGVDSIFEPKESVSLQGNSGPYLQYALSRARSIISKLPSVIITDIAMPSNGYDQYERALLFKLTEYGSVTAQATLQLAPHHVCTYLYELAQVFNRFYEKSRVVGDERETIRLKLIMAYAVILKNGLELLGVPTPERM